MISYLSYHKFSNLISTSTVDLTPAQYVISSKCYLIKILSHHISYFHIHIFTSFFHIHIFSSLIRCYHGLRLSLEQLEESKVKVLQAADVLPTITSTAIANLIFWPPWSDPLQIINIKDIHRLTQKSHPKLVSQPDNMIAITTLCIHRSLHVLLPWFLVVLVMI